MLHEICPSAQYKGDTSDQDILKELDGALQFIHDAKIGDERHRVLVNCAQGVSRSASVTIAYLMKCLGERKRLGCRGRGSDSKESTKSCGHRNGWSVL